MAYCSKCGELLDEIILYTPKTHKEKKERAYNCPIHGLVNKPIHQYVGRTNPNNHACRDWGKIMQNK